MDSYQATAVEDLTRRRHLARLRCLAERLALNAAGNIHVSANPNRNRYGYRLQDEAAAIKWPLLQLEPMTEGPRQVLDSMVAE